jgi:CRISPR-associated protein Cas5t
MLLSLIGVEREKKERYADVKIAVALQDQPEVGRIFRKFRRVGQTKGQKTKKNPNPKPIDPLTERRPDYQELVLWLKFWLWVDDSEAKNSLTEELCKALDKERRKTISRHGALCLGESSHMVNEIKIAVGDVTPTENEGRFLVRDRTGFLTMSVWTDHKNDVPHVETFTLLEPEPLPAHPLEKEKWITVSP